MENKVFFEKVKSINPNNVSGVEGYITKCTRCGDFIQVRFRRASVCLECRIANLDFRKSKHMARFYRSGPWRRLRLVVFEMKGKICRYCRRRATHIDHKLPVSRGGKNNIENLQPVCLSCNSRKMNKTHEEYLFTRKNAT